MAVWGILTILAVLRVWENFRLNRNCTATAEYDTATAPHRKVWHRNCTATAKFVLRVPATAPRCSYPQHRAVRCAPRSALPTGAQVLVTCLLNLKKWMKGFQQSSPMNWNFWLKTCYKKDQAFSHMIKYHHQGKTGNGRFIVWPNAWSFYNNF